MITKIHCPPLELPMDRLDTLDPWMTDAMPPTDAQSGDDADPAMPRRSDAAQHAELLARLRRARFAQPEPRLSRVIQIKKAIEAGGYDTPEKVEALLDNLLDDLAERA